MVVDIHPKPTQRRRRRSVVPDQAGQLLVESALAHLLDDGVHDGVLERDVHDLLAQDVRFGEQFVLVVGL